MSEIVVDNFAGGGGASTGIEMAIGRSVDIAINHDPAAIAMHRANHTTTEHIMRMFGRSILSRLARGGLWRWRGFRQTVSITAGRKAESLLAGIFEGWRGLR